MSKKLPSVRTPRHAIVASFFVVAALVFPFGASVQAPIREADAAIEIEPVALTTPALLSIPSLGLSANIRGVGTDPDGRMSVPVAAHTVGWYEYGAKPGEKGSAVLDAHVYLAFRKLKNLKIGSNVYVSDANGIRLHFIVADIKTYVYNKAPADLIFGRSDAARLNLITCAGTWLPRVNTYDHRLVVFAKLAANF